MKVFIFDFNEEKGEAVAREIGGVFCKVDVTSDSEVDAAFSHFAGRETLLKPAIKSFLGGEAVPAIRWSAFQAFPTLDQLAFYT